MNDKLEEFVRQNRAAFDSREPSRSVWQTIEASLSVRQRPWKKPVTWWRAAAIFFMALSAYLFIPEQHLKLENAQAMKEFTDVEAFYFQQISNKVDLIQELNGTQGLNGFTHDFEQLEAMYLVLKEEMKVRPSQKVKDAMVLNLLVRIDLLNKHLKALEEQKPEREHAGERST